MMTQTFQLQVINPVLGHHGARSYFRSYDFKSRDKTPDFVRGMFASPLSRALRPASTSISRLRLTPNTFRPIALQVRSASRSANMVNFPTPSSDPPQHEMQYFPGMTASLPSESGEFRRVLWTGLYSQVVLMTVPVGGDIGEEVS